MDSSLVFEQFLSLSPDKQQELLPELSEELQSQLSYYLAGQLMVVDYREEVLTLSFPHQIPPATLGTEHNIGLWLCGRGAGKNWFASRQVVMWAMELPGKQIAGLCATLKDGYENMAREILKACPANFKGELKKTERKIVFPNGAEFIWLPSLEADCARGYNFARGWADELCKFHESTAYEFWDNYVKALRVTENAYTIITTTPKPSKLLSEIMNAQGTKVICATSLDNKSLPDSYIAQLNLTKGSSRYRQEVLGELVLENEGAFWTYEMLDQLKAKNKPDGPSVIRTVLAVDPSATDKGDEWGLILVQQYKDRLNKKDDAEILRYCVLEDFSVQMAPQVAVKKIIEIYYKYHVDEVVYESNQGGQMVKGLIHQLDSTINVRSVHHSKSKAQRASEVSIFYEQGLVKHYIPPAGRVYGLSKLEDEMCSWTPLSKKSPNRVDALGIGIQALAKKQKRKILCFY